MARYVIEAITTDGSAGRLLLYVLVFSLSMVALSVVNNIMGTKIEWKAYNNRIKYMILLNEKYIDADYDVIENPENHTKFNKAFTAVQNSSGGTDIITGSGVKTTSGSVVKTVSTAVGFVTYSAILLTLSPVLVVVLSVLSVGHYFAYRSLILWAYRNRDNWAPIDRKLSYIQRSAGDFANAKDIRLYSIGEWFGSFC